MAAEPKKQILDFIYNFIGKLATPRDAGKPLVGDLKGYHSYRTGNYRVICKIKDELLLVTVVEAAHRKDVYQQI